MGCQNDQQLFNIYCRLLHHMKLAALSTSSIESSLKPTSLVPINYISSHKVPYHKEWENLVFRCIAIKFAAFIAIMYHIALVIGEINAWPLRYTAGIHSWDTQYENIHDQPSQWDTEITLRSLNSRVGTWGVHYGPFGLVKSSESSWL
jgi:hypothetical protein